MVDMPFCELCGSDKEETAEHAFFYCPKVRPLWSYVNEVTARIVPDRLVQLDVAYVVDSVSPPYSGEKRKVFFAELAVARMVIFSCRDLISYFKHQLRVKIRCDKKKLPFMTFCERWVSAASLCARVGAGFESTFPSSHGHYCP